MLTFNSTARLIESPYAEKMKASEQAGEFPFTRQGLGEVTFPIISLVYTARL